MSFFFSSRRRHTRCLSDWSSDVCSSDLRNLGSADEVQAAMVEVVGVEVIEAMLLGAGAHVDVDKPVVERGKHSGSDVSHEMLADLAARVRQTIWEFPGL